MCQMKPHLRDLRLTLRANLGPVVPERALQPRTGYQLEEHTARREHVRLALQYKKWEIKRRVNFFPVRPGLHRRDSGTN